MSSLGFPPLPTDFWSQVPKDMFIFNLVFVHYFYKPFLTPGGPAVTYPRSEETIAQTSVSHSIQTKYTLNSVFPESDPKMLTAIWPEDKREGREAAVERTQLCRKYIPFANFTKTQDSGNTALGFFPGPCKDQTKWGALKIELSSPESRPLD
jgi:hypothetical protein